jgi:hypothetical protein
MRGNARRRPWPLSHAGIQTPKEERRGCAGGHALPSVPRPPHGAPEARRSSMAVQVPPPEQVKAAATATGMIRRGQGHDPRCGARSRRKGAGPRLRHNPSPAALSTASALLLRHVLVGPGGLEAGGGRRAGGGEPLKRCITVPIPAARRRHGTFPGRPRWPGPLARRGAACRPPPGCAGHAPHRLARGLLGGPVERRGRSRDRGRCVKSLRERTQSAQKRFVPMHPKSAIANNALGVDEVDHTAYRPVFLPRTVERCDLRPGIVEERKRQP